MPVTIITIILTLPTFLNIVLIVFTASSHFRLLCLDGNSLFNLLTFISHTNTQWKIIYIFYLNAHKNDKEQLRNFIITTERYTLFPPEASQNIVEPVINIFIFICPQHIYLFIRRNFIPIWSQFKMFTCFHVPNYAKTRWGYSLLLLRPFLVRRTFIQLEVSFQFEQQSH